MNRLLPFLLLAFFQAARAATPDAGSLLQQITPVVPPIVSPNATGLTVEKAPNAQMPPSLPFKVTSVLVSGNTLFATDILHALIVDAEGQSLTLPQLNAFADRITAYYRQRGYFLARAYIPMQTIENGIVRIQVLEAHYGKIDVDNRSRVIDSLLSDTLAPLKSGQMIEESGMNRSLLLLSDIPGIQVDASLRPGDMVGTSDMHIEAQPAANYGASVALDNFGNETTGRDRLGINLDYFEPFCRGDVISASVLTSGADMHYGRMSYEALVSGSGMRLGAALSSVHYILGDTLSALGGHGFADVQSLWLRRPLERSTDANVYAQIQYDLKRLDDRIDAVSINTQRHLENRSLMLSGDWREHFLRGSTTTWNIAYTSGRTVFDNGAAALADTRTAKTAGVFAKWTASLGRTQSLTSADALYVSLSKQWAYSNLDASEKMVIGGAYSVRAYATGVASGDIGHAETIELRHDFPVTASGQFQSLVFVDKASVKANRNAWSAGANPVALSGIGLGLNWSAAKQISIKASLARSIGAVPASISADRSVNGWVSISKSF